MKKIKEVKNFSFLEHSSLIGGRFSIFSIVGLIPAKLSGFNIELFCSSGLNFFKEIASDTKIFDYYFTRHFVHLFLLLLIKNTPFLS